MECERTVLSFGNSLAVVIPDAIVKQLKIKKSDILYFDIVDKKIQVRTSN